MYETNRGVTDCKELVFIPNKNPLRNGHGALGKWLATSDDGTTVCVLGRVAGRVRRPKCHFINTYSALKILQNRRDWPTGIGRVSSRKTRSLSFAAGSNRALGLEGKAHL